MIQTKSIEAMIRNKKKILILPGNEMKTSQQLLILQIDYQLPFKEVEIDGILHKRLTENGIVYANFDETEEQRVLNLPYVIAIEPYRD